MTKALFLMFVLLFSPLQSSAEKSHEERIAEIEATEAARIADIAAAREADRDQREEAEKQAMLGTITAVAGGVASAAFYSEGKACEGSFWGSWCAPGFYALSAVSALVAIDAALKGKKAQDTAGQIGNTPPLTIPEACAATRSCSILADAALALGTDPDTPPPNICLGPSGANACDLVITPRGNGESEVKIGDETLTEEEVNELASRFARNPAVAKAIKAIQKEAQNKAKGSVHRMQTELEKKKKKVAKKKSRKKANDYKTGKGFSAPPTSTASVSYSGNEDADPFEKQLQGLMAQFRSKKKRKPAHATVTVSESKVGAIQENIFVMAHRRYQKLRSREEVIERASKTKTQVL